MDVAMRNWFDFCMAMIKPETPTNVVAMAYILPDKRWALRPFFAAIATAPEHNMTAPAEAWTMNMGVNVLCISC